MSLLDAADGPVGFDELADALAAIDRDDGSEPPEGVVVSLRLSLRHVDLPGLEEVGVVDFDPDRRTVAIDEPPAT